jgi:hypothetical protein
MLFKKPIKKSNRRAGKTSLRLKEKFIKEKIEALLLATYNFIYLLYVLETLLFKIGFS